MAKSINLASLSANGIVVFNNGSAVGTITAVAGKVAGGDVNIMVNGKAVNLSDAGCSYLGKSLSPMKMAEAKANPTDVLLVLASGSTELVSPTDCANASVKAGATETSFEVATSEMDLTGVDNVKYVHAGKTGSIEVLEVKQGGVVIQLDNVFELSDEGSSYISTDLKEIKLAEAEADPTKVLFALKKGSTKLVSPKLVSNGKIVSGSIDTAFLK